MTDYRELIREACAQACESDRRSGLDKLIRQKCADAIRSLDLDKIAPRPEPVGYANREDLEDALRLGTSIVFWAKQESLVSGGVRIDYDVPLYADLEFCAGVKR
jgi:hypothetical protein